VIVVLDDSGFAHFGCYGSTIETPNIDRLAAGGLRFTGFHTTALCSPSRACLLPGRNHHAVGMRAISNMDTGFPNMRGALPRSAATLAEILRDHGHATFAAGKWHLAPMAECTAAGPLHNWPLQRGFDRYYGLLQAETDQFYPELTSDNHFVRAGTTDIANDAKGAASFRWEKTVGMSLRSSEASSRQLRTRGANANVPCYSTFRAVLCEHHESGSSMRRVSASAVRVGLKGIALARFFGGPISHN
jgi:arylsulfatase A-like enzyme